MTDENILTVHHERDVAVITLDDGKANALSFGMLDAIGAALDEAESSAKAIAIIGRDGKFCAGFDLSVMTGDPAGAIKLLSTGGDLALRLLMIPFRGVRRHRPRPGDGRNPHHRARLPRRSNGAVQAGAQRGRHRNAGTAVRRRAVPRPAVVRLVHPLRGKRPHLFTRRSRCRRLPRRDRGASRPWRDAPSTSRRTLPRPCTRARSPPLARTCGRSCTTAWSPRPDRTPSSPSNHDRRTSRGHVVLAARLRVLLDAASIATQEGIELDEVDIWAERTRCRRACEPWPVGPRRCPRSSSASWHSSIRRPPRSIALLEAHRPDLLSEGTSRR